MLPDILARYLKSIDFAVRELANSYVERYEEEHLTSNRVNLRIRIRTERGYLLELNESVVAEEKHIRHLDYRYHFQDKENKIVFRYDSTPHFPDLKSFPDYKHLFDTVIASEKPSIEKIIQEIKLYLKERDEKIDLDAR